MASSSVEAEQVTAFVKQTNEMMGMMGQPIEQLMQARSLPAIEVAHLFNTHSTYRSLGPLISLNYDAFDPRNQMLSLLLGGICAVTYLGSLKDLMVTVDGGTVAMQAGGNTALAQNVVRMLKDDSFAVAPAMMTETVRLILTQAMCLPSTGAAFQPIMTAVFTEFKAQMEHLKDHMELVDFHAICETFSISFSSETSQKWTMPEDYNALIANTSTGKFVDAVQRHVARSCNRVMEDVTRKLRTQQSEAMVQQATKHALVTMVEQQNQRIQTAYTVQTQQRELSNMRGDLQERDMRNEQLSQQLAMCCTILSGMNFRGNTCEEYTYARGQQCVMPVKTEQLPPPAPLPQIQQADQQANQLPPPPATPPPQIKQEQQDDPIPQLPPPPATPPQQIKQEPQADPVPPPPADPVSPPKQTHKPVDTGLPMPSGNLMGMRAPPIRPAVRAALEADKSLPPAPGAKPPPGRPTLRGLPRRQGNSVDAARDLAAQLQGRRTYEQSGNTASRPTSGSKRRNEGDEPSMKSPRYEGQGATPRSARSDGAMPGERVDAYEALPDGSFQGSDDAIPKQDIAGFVNHDDSDAESVQSVHTDSDVEPDEELTKFISEIKTPR